ncbi:MAG: deoxyuridine 5'-triphosphate nucleotidohydrolase [Clostridiales bacterium]|nr:deoxyuridine 5'-triphosphate nucleotidohydrolase [Clostridiales bacterium]MDY5349354.1 deoxyuridine 5'-triphosphate nucleotidohydrolase [Candidatus Ventricola sp.]MDY5515560.1 deoxyuridine 5'-triphosphate nucleotidohydrolase [Candidatus Ventricola sp.]
MVRIARFEKVSARRFVEDWITTFPQQTVEQALFTYEHIKLPHRATAGSAGYDFFAPVGFELPAGGSIKIPTGVRALIEEGWVLTLYPRSGLGFKYRFQLDNSVGVIDSDYARSDNEGHIFLRMTNDSREGKGLRVSAGTAFAQGIFLPFGITLDDDVQTVRNGGLGSTTKA